MVCRELVKRVEGGRRGRLYMELIIYGEVMIKSIFLDFLWGFYF